MSKERWYICHEYGGLDENKDRITDIVVSLISQYPDVCPVSPVHAFGYLYDVLDYDDGIKLCLDELRTCDKLICFGSESMSKGCLLEKRAAEKFFIPVLDMGEP